MNLHPRQFYDPVGRKRKRYNKMIDLLHIDPSDTILDVGCGEGLTFEKFNEVNPITGADLFEQSKIKQKNFKYRTIKGDGTLPFKDNEFDIAISVGVLEHIHPYETLKKTCEEIARVGKKYLILVPNYWTIVEPHYSFPLFQHLPKGLQKFLHNKLKLRLELNDEKENPYEEITYLKTKKWLELFPDGKAEVYKHIGPLITNLIVYRD